MKNSIVWDLRPPFMPEPAARSSIKSRRRWRVPLKNSSGNIRGSIWKSLLRADISVGASITNTCARIRRRLDPPGMRSTCVSAPDPFSVRRLLRVAQCLTSCGCRQRSLVTFPQWVVDFSCHPQSMQRRRGICPSCGHAALHTMPTSGD
jgi:hypothetical protein